jgi:ketosteroid isomerase-like protein
MSIRAQTLARSSEHHVAVGLQFWSAFSKGDIDACVELLHPKIEWHPTPRLDEADVVRGQHDVGFTLQALHDRFSNLEVRPEDGRQVGDHVLMVTMLVGSNQFTGQSLSSRQAWVVSIRDDKLGRIVAYPNAPAARLGFEEILKASGPEKNPPDEEREGVTLAPEMENSAATPAELANSDPAAAAAAPRMQAAPAGNGNQITLTFSFEEAEALNRWMLKPAQDGGLAADDQTVRPGLMKIRTAVEHAQAIAAVRHELEQAGVPTQHLSDQQVAQLGRRISQAAPRLGGAQG